MEAKKAKGPIQYVEAFNRSLKLLVTDLNSRYPNDAVVRRAHQRTMTVIAVSPLFAMDAVGQYMYGYREQIYALEQDSAEIEAFFLDNDYDAELKAGVKKEKVDLVKYIMPKAKECIRGLKDAEKKAYKKLVVDLLDNYVEYLAATQIDAKGKANAKAK